MDGWRRTGSAAGVVVALAVILALQAPARGEDGDPLWQSGWRPVPPWEWIIAAGVFIGTEVVFQTSLQGVDPNDADWRGGILFDDAFRDWVRIESRQGREDANVLSDWLSIWTVNYPLVDIVVAAALHRDTFTAAQLGGMLLQSTAAANFTVRMMQTVVQRERPLGPECDRDADYDGLCDEPGRVTAFWSGHTAGAFTGAGLTCAWHLNMPLYGGGFADVLPCAVNLGAAAVQGYLRIASDRHYVTDVLVGAGVGFFLGYGLPVIFHFTERDEGPPPMVLPLLSGDLIGIGAAFRF